MKKLILFIGLIILLSIYGNTYAQCSICTKTAQQLGDKPANGLNLSIFFLAFTPLILIGIIWYRWRKNEKLES